MKKESKKKLELELTAAIQAVLVKHNIKGIPKAKKAIKQASKSVAKKFNKALKVIALKKEAVAKAKKKTVKKVVVRKAVASKIIKVKRRVHKAKATLPATPVAQPISSESAESQSL